MTAFKFFCDEAGNTGSNIADRRQPVYVLGGWLIEDLKVPAFESFISSQKTSGSELKARDILNRPEGWRWGAAFLQGLAKTGGVPIFVLLEKRYAVVAKLIEFFLDPPTNPRIPLGFTGNADAKQEIAEILYVLPDPLLQEFAAAYHECNRAGIVSAYRKLVLDLDLRSPEIAGLFRGAGPQVEWIASRETGIKGFGSAIMSMNLPVFFSMLYMLESLGRKFEIDSIEIVHDETREFKGAFERAFGLIRNGTDKSVRLSNGGEIHGRARVLKDLKFAVSHESFGVQAAEILVGSLFRMGAKAASGESMGTEMQPMADLTLPAFLKDEMRIAWLISSGPFWYRLSSLLAPSLVA